MHGKSIYIPLLALVLAGCGQQRASEPDAEKTREEAKAAGAEVREDARQAGQATREAAAETREKARQAGQDIERRTRDERAAIREGAKDAAVKTKAAVGGFIEGWRAGDRPVDLNAASVQELRSVGFSADEAEKIVVNRPYTSERELVSKGVLGEQRFEEMGERVDVKR